LHRPAHHAVPGGGRPAGLPRRHHRPGTEGRRGHAHPAQAARRRPHTHAPRPRPRRRSPSLRHPAHPDRHGTRDESGAGRERAGRPRTGRGGGPRHRRRRDRPRIDLAARTRPRRRLPPTHREKGEPVPTATATRLTRSASSVRLLPAIGVVVWRHLVQIRHNPEQLVELAIQPVLFVLLFGIVLAGQMGGTGGDYLSFVVPGLMIQAAVLVTARTAIGLHADVTSGLMQRLQTLPLSRLAPLAGRIVADFLMLLWSLTILVAAAVIIGYRASVTVPAALAVLGVIFGFGFSL